MKKQALYVALLIVLVFASCKKEEPAKPKVIYENNPKTKTEVPEDSTQIEIADLPVHLSGTNFLIYPIGTVTSDKKSLKSYDSVRVIPFPITANIKLPVTCKTSNFRKWVKTRFMR